MTYDVSDRRRSRPWIGHGTRLGATLAMLAATIPAAVAAEPAPLPKPASTKAAPSSVRFLTVSAPPASEPKELWVSSEPGEAASDDAWVGDNPQDAEAPAVLDAPEATRQARLGPAPRPVFPEFPAPSSAGFSLVEPIEAPPALAQQPTPAPPLPREPAAVPDIIAEDFGGEPFEIIDQTGELTVILRRSKLLRTKAEVYRTAVVDPSICDVTQFTPRELSIIGKSQGATHVTFWFQDESRRPMTYLVRVTPDPEVGQRREEQYGLLEKHVNQLFPNSKVELVLVSDKLIVRGQARDAAEAAQILAIIRGEVITAGAVVSGAAANPVSQEESNRSVAGPQVINMLRIPGVHQVALKVKIAELNRSAARNFGVDLDATIAFDGGSLLIQSLLAAINGAEPSIVGSFDSEKLNLGVHYLEAHGVVRMLSEPTLVTLSGRPATFIAGGEFAVPTTVGVAGAAAVTTDFRAYGAIITFLPVVIDKDHIRLEVAPEFSQIDSETSVNGTPGLRTRAVTTTVEMREGQTLAIAGLLDDSMKGDTEGDVPLLGQIFGRRGLTRNETELLILVTPELVHPMEPEEVPPLPGFDVTEPTNWQFYIGGRIEGRPTHEYRSTVWPRLRKRYQAGGPVMISGPFGHGQ